MLKQNHKQKKHFQGGQEDFWDKCSTWDLTQRNSWPKTSKNISLHKRSFFAAIIMSMMIKLDAKDISKFCWDSN